MRIRQQAERLGKAPQRPIRARQRGRTFPLVRRDPTCVHARGRIIDQSSTTLNASAATVPMSSVRCMRARYRPT
jgi:hypothetical protein